MPQQYDGSGSADAAIGVTISRANRDAIGILTVVGTLIEDESSRFAEALGAVLDEHPSGVVVDTSGVDAISVGALSALVDFQHKARCRGVRWAHVTNNPVAGLLKSRVDGVIAKFDTVDTAITYCQARHGD